MSRRALAALSALLLTAGAAGAAEDGLRRLWASPWEGIEQLDQSQPTHGSRTGGNRLQAKPDRPVSQTFVPTRSPLVRIDLLINNRYDPRPGRVRIHRWRGSHAGSVASEPVFEDVLDLSGDVGFRLRTLFPRIAVEPAQTYLLELAGPERGELALQHASGGASYPRGKLFVAGVEKKGADLWFRTWTAPEAELASGFAPRVPTLEPSDPSLPWHEPAPEAGRVRRAEYRKRIAAHAAANRRGFLTACKDLLHRAAPLYGFLYRASCLEGDCDEAHAAAVRDLLLNVHAGRFCGPRAVGSCERACDPDPELAFWWLEPAALAALWTRDSPSFSAADRHRVEALLVDSARRLVKRQQPTLDNRVVTLAAGYAALAALVPDHASAPSWRAYAEATLDRFLRDVDTLEDSAQYTSVLFLPGMLELAALSGREDELWGNAAFLELVESKAALIAPLGVEPNFGDGSGWARDPGGLVWLFEKAAAKTRKPHYRWLAHRLYRYNERVRDQRPREDSLYASLPWLGWAWLDADDDLEPAAPSGPASPVVTRRRAVRSLSKDSWKSAGVTAVFEQERVPDKLVLRSGFEPSGLHAVVNLLGGYPHGQSELGALVSLVDGGAVLLADGPFPYAHYDPARQDESAPLLRRYWGGRAGEPGRHAQVDHLRDAREASVAWLRWDDPDGWSVEQERRIYFVRDRFVWVRDRFRFPHAMGAAAGPVWHAGDVHPEHGGHWWDVSYRSPLSNVWRVRNPEHHALVFFVPRADRQQAALLERSYLPPAGCKPKPDAHRVAPRCRHTPPYVLYQRWTGEAPAGKELWFDTLLLPHAPANRAVEVAQQVRVLHADAAATALEVELGDERWRLVANPSAGRLRVGDLETDARYALFREAPGRSPYLLVREATGFRSGARDYRFGDRSSAELDGEPASDGAAR